MWLVADDHMDSGGGANPLGAVGGVLDGSAEVSESVEAGGKQRKHPPSPQLGPKRRL